MDTHSTPHRPFSLFGAIEQMEDADADTAALLHKVAKAFAVLDRVLPKAVPALDSLKPVVVLDVAGSNQPGAMALVGTLGLFPTSVEGDGAGAAMLRSAVARATPAQRPDLLRLMAGIAPVS